MSQFPTCGHGWPLGLHRTLWLLCALSYAHVVLQSPYFFFGGFICSWVAPDISLSNPPKL